MRIVVEYSRLQRAGLFESRLCEVFAATSKGGESETFELFGIS